MIVLAPHSHFAILGWCTCIFEKWIVSVCFLVWNPICVHECFCCVILVIKGQSWGAISTFYHFIFVEMGGIVKSREKKNKYP
jgi:hypothetical protein